jgi:hypothetical protein
MVKQFEEAASASDKRGKGRRRSPIVRVEEVVSAAREAITISKKKNICAV